MAWYLFIGLFIVFWNVLKNGSPYSYELNPLRRIQWLLKYTAVIFLWLPIFVIGAILFFHDKYEKHFSRKTI